MENFISIMSGYVQNVSKMLFSTPQQSISVNLILIEDLYKGEFYVPQRASKKAIAVDIFCRLLKYQSIDFRCIAVRPIQAVYGDSPDGKYYIYHLDDNIILGIKRGSNLVQAFDKRLYY